VQTEGPATPSACMRTVATNEEPGMWQATRENPSFRVPVPSDRAGLLNVMVSTAPTAGKALDTEWGSIRTPGAVEVEIASVSFALCRGD
jgi:hypothetical protein